MRERCLVPASAMTAAGICWVTAGVVYLLAEAVTASAFPDYSYADNYISDLGIPEVEVLSGRAIDSPLFLVITVAFVIEGGLFVVAACLVARGARFPLRRTFLTLALIHGVGMVTIAVVHGGRANSEAGLASVHLLGAALAMFGGQFAAVIAGIALLRIGRWPHAGGGTRKDGRLGGVRRALGMVSIALGVAGCLGIVMLEIDVRAVPATILPDGVWERIGFYAIVAWELLIGAAALVRARGHGAGGHA